MASSIYDSDTASTRCQRMWRKLGGLMEKHSYEAADKGFLETALKAARIADVCFWQATGELDCMVMKDLLPQEPRHVP